jgi:hypothetical protein
MARLYTTNARKGPDREREGTRQQAEELGESGPTERGREPAAAERVGEREGGSVAARHMAERAAMYKAHEDERRDTHERHRREHRDMRDRHMADHEAINHEDAPALMALHRRHEHEHHALRGRHLQEHHEMHGRHMLARHDMHARHEHEVASGETENLAADERGTAEAARERKAA